MKDDDVAKKKLRDEARHWDAQPSLQEWVDAPRAVPRAGESTSITLRVPTKMLSILKEFAQREGVGYQSLLKGWLDDRIRVEAAKFKKKL